MGSGDTTECWEEEGDKGRRRGGEMGATWSGCTLGESALQVVREGCSQTCFIFNQRQAEIKWRRNMVELYLETQLWVVQHVSEPGQG